MDPAVVKVEWTAWFPSTAVMAGRRGPGSGDGQEDGVASGRGGDRRVAWTQW
jgi:hypothetical protein